MEDIDFFEASSQEHRGKIRRIISPAGRHRASGKTEGPYKPLPLSVAQPVSSPPRAEIVNPTPPNPTEQTRLDSVVAAYQNMVLERVDQGIAQMQRSAAKLMNEIASEVWRAVGPDAGENLGDRVLGLLARDDSVRGLIAHSDERFHSLDVRIQRMEAGLKMVADKMKQSHLAVVGDLDSLRRAVTTNLTRASEQSDRSLAAISEQIDATTRRLHSQTSRIAAQLEEAPLTHLDRALVLMMEHLQRLDRAMAATPDATARRVVVATGMVSDQLQAASGDLVRQIRGVADQAIERVVTATESAAGHALTTTEAIAARLSAQTDAATGWAVQVSEDLSNRVAEAAEGAAERMAATGDALVQRFDAMGKVLVDAAVQETETVASLEDTLREMQGELAEMAENLFALKRDVAGRGLGLASTDDVSEPISAIDAGFFGSRPRRRPRAAAS